MTATEDSVAALSAAAPSSPRAAAPTAGPAFVDPTPRLDDLAGRLEALSGDLVALEALVEARGGSGSAASDASVAQTGTPPTGAISADPALLSTLLQLAERVGRIEGRPVATPEDVTRLSLADRDAMDAVMEAREALSTTRDSVEETRAALAKAREAIDATRGEIDGLKGEMSDISASVATLGPKRDTASLLLLAVGQLTTATSGPGGFATELATVRRIAGSDEATVAAFDSLSAHASGGTPSRTSLRARFPAVMESALQTRAAGTAEGTIGEALNRVAALATVRKLSRNEVASVDAALNVAEVAVAEGDLAGAVDALTTLDGPAADKVAGWVADAKARLAVDAAVSTLSAVVLERLSSVE
jgi:hypothetical protein